MMESENQTVCRGRNLCAVWLSFYMEVDERKKMSKKKYATVFAYYR
jgi:hypothetical protein